MRPAEPEGFWVDWDRCTGIAGNPCSIHGVDSCRQQLSMPGVVSGSYQRLGAVCTAAIFELCTQLRMGCCDGFAAFAEPEVGILA